MLININAFSRPFKNIQIKKDIAEGGPGRVQLTADNCGDDSAVYINIRCRAEVKSQVICNKSQASLESARGSQPCA